MSLRDAIILLCGVIASVLGVIALFIPAAAVKLLACASIAAGLGLAVSAAP